MYSLECGGTLSVRCRVRSGDRMALAGRDPEIVIAGTSAIHALGFSLAESKGSTRTTLWRRPIMPTMDTMSRLEKIKRQTRESQSFPEASDSIGL